MKLVLVAFSILKENFKGECINMKMSDEQYNQLDIAVNDVLRNFKDILQVHVKRVFDRKLYKDFKKRILWDIFYKSASHYFF